MRCAPRDITEPATRVVVRLKCCPGGSHPSPAKTRAIRQLNGQAESRATIWEPPPGRTREWRSTFNILCMSFTACLLGRARGPGAIPRNPCAALFWETSIMLVRFCFNNPKTLGQAALEHRYAQTREQSTKSRPLEMVGSNTNLPATRRTTARTWHAKLCDTTTHSPWSSRGSMLNRAWLSTWPARPSQDRRRGLLGPPSTPPLSIA